MKTSYLPLIAALTLGVSLPALAGPDFQAIEKARAARQAAGAAQAVTTRSRQRLRPAGEMSACPIGAAAGSWAACSNDARRKPDAKGTLRSPGQGMRESRVVSASA